jgi:hypothetical protein
MSLPGDRRASPLVLPAALAFVVLAAGATTFGACSSKVSGAGGGGGTGGMASTATTMSDTGGTGPGGSPGTGTSGPGGSPGTGGSTETTSSISAGGGMFG